jgi:WD40 repeat protein
MGFAGLSLPIPEELLAKSILSSLGGDGHSNSSAKSSTSNSTATPVKTTQPDELTRVIEEFEFHSKKASEAAARIRLLYSGQQTCSSPPIYTSTSSSGMDTTDEKPKLETSKYKLTAATSILKAFGRKPRSLARLDTDRFIGTSLDGRLTLFSYAEKNSLERVSLSSEQVHVAECIAANESTGQVVVAVNEETSDGGSKPTMFIYDKHLRRVSMRPPCGHAKAIACVDWCDASTIVTGSVDHTVSISSANTRTVVNAHTSTVSSVKYWNGNVYSAGLDGRLNKVDAVSGKLVETKKYSGQRFSQLLLNPLPHPHMLITCTLSTHDQFMVLDGRAGHKQVAKFGWAESSNLSGYVKAGWRPSGNAVVVGTQSPKVGESRLLLFDVRRGAGVGAVVLRDGFGERRWLECCFLSDERLVANATDGSLTFASLSP